MCVGVHVFENSDTGSMVSAEAARIAFMKAVRKSVISILFILTAGCESVAAAAAEAAGRRVAKARRVPHLLVPFTTALHDGVSM